MLDQQQRDRLVNAARFVTGIYDRTRSVSAILQELNWQSLQDRRTSSRLAMMYKIRYGLVDIEWNQYLVHLSTSTRGHKSRFVIPHTKSTVFTNSFFPRTIRDWNSLAVDPAEYKSLEAFKLALKAHPSKQLSISNSFYLHLFTLKISALDSMSCLFFLDACANTQCIYPHICEAALHRKEGRKEGRSGCNDREAILYLFLGRQYGSESTMSFYSILFRRGTGQLGPKSTRSQVISVPGQLGPKSTRSFDQI